MYKNKTTLDLLTSQFEDENNKLPQETQNQSFDDLNLNGEEINFNNATIQTDNDILDETSSIEIDDFSNIAPMNEENTTQLNVSFEQMRSAQQDRISEIGIQASRDERLVPDNEFGKVNIMVIGIGGCGSNAINRMYEERISEIKLVAMDTSEQTLENIKADYKLLLGENTLIGHGTGGDVKRAEDVFSSTRERIQQILQGVDMVFLAGGIGRGTGSVGLVEVGKIAREMGILTIGFATLPRRMEANMEIISKYYPQFVDAVDSNVIVENEKVGLIAKNLPIMEAMKIADSMLVDGIRGIFELITKPGKINLDYADIKTAFADQGSCVMGIGFGSGEDAVTEAIKKAVHSEIVNFESVKNAKTVIFNITCAEYTITIEQASRGTDFIYSFSDTDEIEHLLFGYSYDPNLKDEVKVTFIATGTKVEPVFNPHQTQQNQFGVFGQVQNTAENFFSKAAPKQNQQSDFLKNRTQPQQQTRVAPTERPAQPEAQRQAQQTMPQNNRTVQPEPQRPVQPEVQRETHKKKESDFTSTIKMPDFFRRK